jgi:hypothetical protein
MDDFEVDDRQARVAPQALGRLLVHRRSAAENPGPDVRQSGYFEKTLERPILRMGAVHHRKHAIDRKLDSARVDAGGRHDRDDRFRGYDRQHFTLPGDRRRHDLVLQVPAALLVDPDRGDGIFGAVEVSDDRRGGTKGNLVLARLTSEQYAYVHDAFSEPKSVRGFDSANTVPHGSPPA